MIEDGIRVHRERIISVLPPFIRGVIALATYNEYLFGKCNTDFQQMNCSRSISSSNTTCSTNTTTTTTTTTTATTTATTATTTTTTAAATTTTTVSNTNYNSYSGHPS